MRTVDIVLATYNGEKYLSQQLDSIIEQNYSNWRLLISDDGSSDGTLSIVEKYIKIDSRIRLVNKKRQGGVVKNFAKGLEFVSSDYIMFSDQDDYWLPEKISCLLKILEEKERLNGNVPLLIFTDLIVVDQDLKTLKCSFFEQHSLKPSYNFDTRFLLWRSTVYGCTVMFNKALYDVATPFASDVNMHDQWFALMASIKGHVLYSEVSHVLYRQHANNVVGAQEKTFLARLKNALTAMKKIKHAACVTNRIAIRIYGVQHKYFLNKIIFVNRNIIPYYYSNKLYATIFILFYILIKN